jgi:hypothetical protein
MKNEMLERRYFLLDASVVVGHYLPRASTERVNGRINRIVSAARRKGQRKGELLLFVPNFCVAEVFNTFRKYRYGRWNRKVRDSGGVIGKKEFDRIYGRFQQDIRKGRVFYHYELSRYHLLNTALISPIDHHYAYQRNIKKKKPCPMSTLDLLIAAMGIELVRLHGRCCVRVLTTDSRIANILGRAERIRGSTVERLDLHKATRLVGLSVFSASIFPQVFDLSKGTEADFRKLLAADSS